MPALTLTRANRAAIHALLSDDTWCVACLCAAWCDVCTDFRSTFDRIADAHPGMTVLWIDIEDEADVVGDFDVENFPTLLIQRGDRVAFFGAVTPDAGTVNRLITSLAQDRDASSQAPTGLPDLRRSLSAALAG
jgi:thioredoxin 1